MNQTTLEDALVDIINNITTSVTTAKDFLVSEVPDVIHQLILWKTCKYALLLIICLVIIIVAYRYIRIVHDIPDKNTATLRQKNMVASWRSSDFLVNELTTLTQFNLVISYFLVILCGIISVVDLFYILKIIVAPKVWLIEYAADLVTAKAK